MQFIVPQNLDIEDSIFLGLSFRQIIYLGGSIGIIFVSFFLFDSFLAIIISFPFAALGFALGFIKFNSRPFIHLIQSWVIYITSNKLYIWQKSKHVKTQLTEQVTHTPKNKKEKNLTKLSSSLNIGV